MKRILSSLSLGVSLALLVLLMCLWIISYIRTDIIMRERRRSCLSMLSEFGRLIIQVEGANEPLWEDRWIWFAQPPGEFQFTSVGPLTWHRLGFSVSRRVGTYDTVGWRNEYVIPWWAPTALMTIPPILRIRRALIRRRRRRRGLCPNCGYDIRASSGVCTECGARVPVSMLLERAKSVTEPPISTSHPSSR